jgi:hypothetical protein
MSRAAPIHIDSRESHAERDADQRAAKALGTTLGTASSLRAGQAPKTAYESGPAPSSVAATLSGSGSTLPHSVQSQMSEAFGTDFSHVRLHQNEQAERSMREVGAPAYSVGHHIVMAQNLGDGTSGLSQQVLGHELAHVAQNQESGSDQPILRRVGFFESIERFFGGGTFEKGELIIYLNGLRDNKKIEDNNDSDNKARAVVLGGLHKTETLAVRILLIEEMRSGHIGDDDQNAMLTIMEEATPAERFEMMRRIGQKKLEDSFDGKDLKRFYALVETNESGKPYPVPTNWRFEYGIQGASEFRDKQGILLDSLQAKPASAEESLPVISETQPILLKGGESAVVNPNLDHPRDQGGTGYADFRIGQVEGDGKLTPLGGAPVQVSGDYPKIVHETGGVTAHLDVKMHTLDVGSDTTTTGTETGTAHTTEKETAKGASVSDKKEVIVSAEKGEKQSVDVKKTDKKEESKGSSDTKSEGSSETDIKSEQDRTMKKKEETKTDGTSTTKGSETSLSTSFELQGMLDVALKGEIEASLGIKNAGDSKTGIGKSLLARLLKLIGKRAMVLLTVLDLIDEAKVGVKLGADGRFWLYGKLTGEAAKKWTESETKSASTAKTEGTEEEKTTGKGHESQKSTGKEHVDSTGESKGEETSVGVGKESSVKTGVQKVDGQVVTHDVRESEKKGDTTSRSDKKEEANSTKRIRAVIEEAKLSFRLTPTGQPTNKPAAKPKTEATP